MELKDLAILAIAAVVIAFVVTYVKDSSNSCDSKNGVEVRTRFSYVCVDKKVVLP
jgi:hypothetical protein